MVGDMSVGVVVAGLGDAVTALLALDPSRLQATETVEVLRGLEEQAHRLAAAAYRVVSEMDERGTAGELCYPSTAAVLQDLLHVTGREAKARVCAARELTVRHDLTGTVLPPVLPATAAALVCGTISPAHARVISSIMRELEGAADAAFGAEIEAALAEHSAQLDPVQVAKAGRLMLARLNPDGDEPTDQTQQRQRSFTLSKNADGSARVSGRLTPAAAAVWDAILDSLAAPVPSGEIGERDDRSPGQRRHDALLDAGQRLLNSGTLPDCGGTPVTVAVTISARDLHTASSGHGSASASARRPDQPAGGRHAYSGGYGGTYSPTPDGTRGADRVEQPTRSADEYAGTCRINSDPCNDGNGGHGRGDGYRGNGSRGGYDGRDDSNDGRFGAYGQSSHGDLISIAELLDLAAEAEIIPVVLNDAGGVLAYGRTRRLASPAQRRALAARDRGCSFPGCTRPPAWCSAHHVTAWIDGGNTDLDNLTLVCGYHHREFARRGWRCQLVDGVPRWISPAWLDPDQIPRRNKANHVEILLDIDTVLTGRDP